jgi:hypothetical protein
MHKKVTFGVLKIDLIKIWMDAQETQLWYKYYLMLIIFN